MRYENHKIKFFLDRTRLFFLGATLFYIFCFQYVFSPIDNMLLYLGGMLAILEVLQISFKRYGNVRYVFVFIIFSFLASFLLAYDVQAHLDLTLKIFQYCIPMIAVCGYVNSIERFNQILKVISFSMFVLALSLHVNGVKFTDYGAMTVGDLNSNVLSYYLMIGLLAQLLLLCGTTEKKQRVLLCFFIGVELSAQMLAASRRGVVIFAFLLATFLSIMFFIYYKKNSVAKMMLILACAFIIIWVMMNFSELIDRFVVFRRFLGEFNGGDTARKYYQLTAKELFMESPLLGRGFGCVGAVAGMYSHSMYYELLASTGIIGTGLLLGSMLLNMKSLAKRGIRTKDSEIKMMCYVCTSGLAAMFLSGIAVVGIYDAYFYILLGIFGAFRNVSIERKDENA